METAVAVLEEFLEFHSFGPACSLAFTGTAGKKVAEKLGAPFVNEIIAQAGPSEAFHPKCAPSSDGERIPTLILLGFGKRPFWVIPGFCHEYPLRRSGPAPFSINRPTAWA